MAGEITFSTSLKAQKGNSSVSQSATMAADMTGNQMMQATQNIGTTAELVDFGDITGVPQLVMIRNLDATNFVEIGGDSGLTVFKLKIKKGQSALFEPTSGTLYAKANTAAVNIMTVAIEA